MVALLDLAAWRFAGRALALHRAVRSQKPYHLKMEKRQCPHHGGEPPVPQPQAEQWGEPGREKNERGGVELHCRLSLIDSPKRHLLYRVKVRQRSTPTRLLPVGDPGRRDSMMTFSSTSFAENFTQLCS
jgi:hypothetical protein